MNSGIGIVIAVLIVLGVGVYLYQRIRSKIRDASRVLFHTDSILEGIQSQQEEMSHIPKSVSGMTSVYLPLIGEDFPEFNYEEFKTRSDNMLVSALQAISQGTIETVIHGSENLIHTLELKIQENKLEHKIESYNDIKIHQTEIYQYTKSNGTCKITFQSAVGYHHTIYQEGKLIEGSEQYKKQCKYNIDLIYIQDVSQIHSKASTFDIGTCPNCGAPVSNLGNKMCNYCGCAIEVANVRVWQIDSFLEL